MRSEDLKKMAEVSTPNNVGCDPCFAKLGIYDVRTRTIPRMPGQTLPQPECVKSAPDRHLGAVED